MRTARFFLLLLVTVPIIVSCVQDVILDARDEPQVVVACVLTDDSVQTLRLSFTKGASRSEAPPLTEATATLYEGGEKIGEFRRVQGNEWTLQYSAVTGHSYRLEVEVPGYDKIWAEQTMPGPPALQCVGYTHFNHYIEPWSGWVYPDTPEGVLEIEIVQWPEDEPFPDFETYYVLYESARPVWLFAMNFNPVTGRYEQAKEICTNAIADTCNILGKAYDPPKLDVPNPWKLRKGYGLVDEKTFYSAHRMELYPDLSGVALHDGYIHISPENSHQVFTLSGSFEGHYCDRYPGNYGYLWTWGHAQDLAENEGYILCVTYSEEYEKYLLDSRQYQQIRASTDLSSIFLRDNIYSNINGGGIGIFGAAVQRKYPWARTYVYIDSGIPHVGYRTFMDSWRPYPEDPR